MCVCVCGEDGGGGGGGGVSYIHFLIACVPVLMFVCSCVQISERREVMC